MNTTGFSQIASAPTGSATRVWASLFLRAMSELFQVAIEAFDFREGTRIECVPIESADGVGRIGRSRIA